MPWSSPRSSGCRATDWIIEAKMLPMPTPAPSAPSPTPSARPIAFPAFVTSPEVAASTVAITKNLLVLRLDRRADVDGGHDRDRHDREHDRLQDEHQAEEGQDQDVPGKHVREEPDAQ